MPSSYEKLLTINAGPDAVFDAVVTARQWDGWPTLPKASSRAPYLSVGDEVASPPAATRTVVELERPSLLKLETVGKWATTTETYSIEKSRAGTLFKVTMTAEVVGRWWPRLVLGAGVFGDRFGRTVADECAKVAERVQLLAEADPEF